MTFVLDSCLFVHDFCIVFDQTPVKFNPCRKQKNAISKTNFATGFYSPQSETVDQGTIIRDVEKLELKSNQSFFILNTK